MEDLRSQLVGKTDLEQKLVEDNRVLHQMVMRVDTEKKRLSMENEQLNWKMSQSFTAANKDFNVALGDWFLKSDIYIARENHLTFEITAHEQAEEETNI